MAAQAKRARPPAPLEAWSDSQTTGPSNIEALFSWPDWGFEKLMASDTERRIANIKAMCERKVVLRSHYTGKCTVETVAEYFNILFIKQGFTDAATFITTHAADSDGACQQVAQRILGHGGGHAVRHVFGDWTERRLEPRLLHQIQSMKPKQAASAKEKTNTYQDMWEVLREAADSGTLFPARTLDTCVRHNGLCNFLDVTLAASETSDPIMGQSAGHSCQDFSHMGAKMQKVDGFCTCWLFLCGLLTCCVFVGLLSERIS
jgi:hypothetical protein